MCNRRMTECELFSQRVAVLTIDFGKEAKNGSQQSRLEASSQIEMVLAWTTVGTVEIVHSDHILDTCRRKSFLEF